MIAMETREIEFLKITCPKTLKSRLFVGWMDDEFLPSWLVACYGTHGCHIFNDVDG
jgi:hypothetical protein